MSSLSPIHPFPARMAPEVALAALDGLSAKSVVLDPMCGSGSVLRAAGDHGLRADGFDLDPLAVLMARVWNTPLDTRLFLRSADLAIGRAQTYTLRDASTPWIDHDADTKAFVDYWFDRPQQRQLRRLVRSIRRSPISVRAALELALSRTIITKESGASLARDVSHSRPHKVKELNDFDVYGAFAFAAKRIAALFAKEPPPQRGISVQLGDARRLHQVRSRSIDLVLTSPPYLNAIDYMRGHRLSLVWLGYSLGDLRRVRSNSIGSERAPDPGHDEVVVHDLLTLLPRTVKILPRRRQRMFERYLLDMQAVTEEIARVMRRDARARFVIGNSTVSGVFVSNADALTAVASRAGLRLAERYERQLPSNRRYLPPPTHAQSGKLDLRIRSESVLTFTHEENRFNAGLPNTRRG